jgi:hypothetical protein
LRAEQRKRTVWETWSTAKGGGEVEPSHTTYSVRLLVREKSRGYEATEEDEFSKSQPADPPITFSEI